jgi:hypothetical protein
VSFYQVADLPAWKETECFDRQAGQVLCEARDLGC